MAICEFHGGEKRQEPLTRFDGSRIGSLTVDVCDACEREADDNWDEFCYRISTGDFPETEGTEHQ